MEITPEEMARRMREIVTGDREYDHSNADDLMVEVLCSLGYGEAMDVFERMPKWYA
jgi:hypothetical protein